MIINMKKRFAAFSAKTKIQGSRKGIIEYHSVPLYLHFVFFTSQKFVNSSGACDYSRFLHNFPSKIDGHVN